MSNHHDQAVCGISSDLLAPCPETPNHLSSKPRQWASLILVMIACSIAASPLGSFPSLEPLLVKGQLFNGDTSQLNEMFNVSTAVLCFAALPAGIFYDIFGGRAAGCMGAFLMLLALLLMAFALWNAPRFGWVFYVGLPLGSAAGYLTATSVYPFLWIFPHRQAFVSGVFGASMCLSDLFTPLAVSLDSAFELRLQVFLLMLAAGCTITIVVCYLVVPSRALTLAKARDLLGSEVDVKPNVRTQFRKTWQCLADNRLISSFFVCYNISFFSSFTVISGNILPYYSTLFEDNDAANLCNAFAVIYSFGGGVLALSGGLVCDLVGIVWFTASQVIIIGLTMACISTPIVWVQYLTELLMTVSMGQYIVLSTRFCSMYSTSDFFGMYVGVVSAFMGLGNLLVGTIVNKALASSMSADWIRLASLVLLGLSVFFGVALVAQWCKRPPPSDSKH